MSMILSLLLAAAPASSVPAPSFDRCPKPAISANSAKFQRLGDLPPAQAILAVYRSTDCPVGPVLARDRLGPVPKPRR